MLFNKKEFIQFVLHEQLLKFGDFTTKSGRQTNYFFNVGNIQSGKKLKELATFYARFIIDNNIALPILFGPAYKGISLSIATSIALSELGVEVDFCYNRKEAKTHGEGGTLIGADLKNDVLIIDDVITSGISIEESIRIIKNNHAHPKFAIVALDRKEKAIEGDKLTKDYLENKHDIKVHSLLELNDILECAKA